MSVAPKPQSIVVAALLQVTLCNAMPYARQPASPWFSPLGFLALFPSPPFPGLPRLLAARQKVTACETTIKGANPSVQVLAPLWGSASLASPCFGRLLASPLLAGCLSWCWCSFGGPGALHALSCDARQGKNDTLVSFFLRFNYGRKVAV